jgi:hypothetical protein
VLAILANVLGDIGTDCVERSVGHDGVSSVGMFADQRRHCGRRWAASFIAISEKRVHALGGRRR